MLTARFPWHAASLTDDRFNQYIETRELSSRVPSKFQELVKLMLDPNPLTRITIVQVQHIIETGAQFNIAVAGSKGSTNSVV